MPRFQPSPLPVMQSSSLSLYLADEFRRISDTQGTILTLPVLQSEPRNAVDGMVVYADGVNWDPGPGPGFYGREAGAWKKL